MNWERTRETDVKRNDRFEVLSLLGGKRDRQGLRQDSKPGDQLNIKSGPYLDVGQKMLRFTSSDDGEDVRGLLHHVCESHRSDGGFPADFLGHLVESCTDVDLILSLLRSAHGT